MAFVFMTSTYTGSNRGQFSGGLFRCEVYDDGTPTTMRRVFLPPSTSAVDRYPSGDNYGNAQYLVGGHTSNIMIDARMRCLRQGIRPPNILPNVAPGAGATALIFYTRYFDEGTQERSPLSTGFVTTGAAAGPRTWTLPTEVPNEQIVIEGTATIAAGVVTGDGKCNFSELRPGDRIANAAALNRWAQIRTIDSDQSMTIDDTAMAAGPGAALVAKPVSRVSHIEGWFSDSGSLPRFVFRAPIGVTSVTESTGILAAGEAESESFDAMPVGQFNLFYNDRQLIAGVEGHRDTIYLSALHFPERNQGLAFVTAYNEPIVGLVRFRDYVIVLCPNSSYKLQGYTEDDYVRSVLEPKIGGLGHLTNAVNVGYAVIPSQTGINTFDGAFRPAASKRRTEFNNTYGDNVRMYESGLSIVNPNDETFQFYPRVKSLLDTSNYAVTDPFVWVGDYSSLSPQGDGGLTQMKWTSDTMIMPAGTGIAGALCTYASYMVPSGTRIGALYRGDDYGRIFKEQNSFNENTNIPFEGTSYIVPAHSFYGDFGGNMDEGKGVKRAWSYVISELSAWRLNIWAGDEWCYPVGPHTHWQRLINGGDDPTLARGNFKADVPLSFESASVTYHGASRNIRYAKKSIHDHVPGTHKCVGRGFTFEFQFTNPADVSFIGYGVELDMNEKASRGAMAVEAGGG